jgi:hypothetical protein
VIHQKKKKRMKGKLTIMGEEEKKSKSGECDGRVTEASQVKITNNRLRVTQHRAYHHR